MINPYSPTRWSTFYPTYLSGLFWRYQIYMQWKRFREGQNGIIGYIRSTRVFQLFLFFIFWAGILNFKKENKKIQVTTARKIKIGRR